jgi:hypothetical protein
MSLKDLNTGAPFGWRQISIVAIARHDLRIVTWLQVQPAIDDCSIYVSQGLVNQAANALDPD